MSDGIKKAAAIFAALALVTAIGCTSVFRESKNDESKYGSEDFGKQEVKLTPAVEKTLSLYFLSSDYERIVAETRTIEIDQSRSPEIQVVEALLDGPQDNALRPLISGCDVDNVENLNNVVNVYLNIKSEYTDERVFILALAIANTMYDYLSATYVNVYVNGKAISYEGFPVGLLTKNQGIIADEAAKQQQRAVTGSVPTALYFLDNSEEYLVCEVRSIQYESEDYGEKITEELVRGPEEMYYYTGSLDSSVTAMEGSYVNETEDGKRLLMLNLNKAPVVYTSTAEDNETMAAAAIVYSVMGLMPDIDGICFMVNGEQYDTAVYTKERYGDLLGAEIKLYLSNSDGNMLIGVDRTVKQDIAGFPETIVSELISGPAREDSSDVWPAFPSGILQSDIKDVYVAKNIAVVDFSASIQDKLSGISEQDERVMIFSIVNSLTYLQDITAVQFLINGEREKYLAGYIDIIDPIMKNPGMIKY